MKHFAFPEIGQFRQAIRNVKSFAQKVGVDANGDAIYDSLKPLPKLMYRGTVKLHGTNSAIARSLVTKEISIQSRQRIITVEDDNYGFARFCSNLDLNKLLDMIPLDTTEVSEVSVEYPVVIYGEWCGGSIQDNVALCKLEKLFMVFAIMYKDKFLPRSIVEKVKIPEARVFNIFDFPSFEIEIDFQNPELVQNKLGEITKEVEKECPVSKVLGVIGTGEGVVWSPVDPAYDNPSFWFKVKGDKHSASKVTTLASVDIEKVNSMNELIDKVVTENRMTQGVQVLKTKLSLETLTRANTGDLIRWVFDDVVKEESDTLSASGISQKDIGAALSKKVKEWFFKNVV
jgi:hypothetical protein